MRLKTNFSQFLKRFINVIEHFYGYLKVITKTIWMRIKLANVHWTVFQIYQIQLRSEEKSEMLNYQFFVQERLNYFHKFRCPFTFCRNGFLSRFPSIFRTLCST